MRFGRIGRHDQDPSRSGSGPGRAGCGPPSSPRLGHPTPAASPLADRWTWMVLAAYAQLRLARQLPADARLLWERPRPPGKPSPYRVRWGSAPAVRTRSPALASPRSWWARQLTWD